MCKYPSRKWEDISTGRENFYAIFPRENFLSNPWKCRKLSFTKLFQNFFLCYYFFLELIKNYDWHVFLADMSLWIRKRKGISALKLDGTLMCLQQPHTFFLLMLFPSIRLRPHKVFGFASLKHVQVTCLCWWKTAKFIKLLELFNPYFSELFTCSLLCIAVT